MTIRVKATEQYFLVVLFIMLYFIRRGFKFWSLWMKFCGVTIQVKVNDVNHDVEILNI